MAPRTPSFFLTFSSSPDDSRGYWGRKKRLQKINSKAADFFEKFKFYHESTPSSCFSECSSPCSLESLSETYSDSASTTQSYIESPLSKSSEPNSGESLELFDKHLFENDSDNFSIVTFESYSDIEKITRLLNGSTINPKKNRRSQKSFSSPRKITPYTSWFTLKEKHAKSKFSFQRKEQARLENLNENAVKKLNNGHRKFKKSFSHRFGSKAGMHSLEDMGGRKVMNNENVPIDSENEGGRDHSAHFEGNVPKEAFSCYEMFKSDHRIVDTINLLGTQMNNEDNHKPLVSLLEQDSSLSVNEVFPKRQALAPSSFNSIRETENFTSLNSRNGDTDADGDLIMDFPENEFTKQTRSSFVEMPDATDLPDSVANPVSKFSKIKNNENILNTYPSREKVPGSVFEENDKKGFMQKSDSSSTDNFEVQEIPSSALTQFGGEFLFENELEQKKLKLNSKTKVFDLVKTALKRINSVNNLNHPQITSAEEEQDATMIPIPAFRNKNGDIANILDNLAKGTITRDNLFDATCRSTGSESSSEINVSIRDSSFFFSKQEEEKLRKAKKKPSIQFNKTAQLMIYDIGSCNKLPKAANLFEPKSISNLSLSAENIPNSSRVSAEERSTILKKKENTNAENETIRATHCDDVTLQDFIVFFETHERKRMSAEPQLSEQRKRQIAKYYQDNES